MKSTSWMDLPNETKRLNDSYNCVNRTIDASNVSTLFVNNFPETYLPSEGTWRNGRRARARTVQGIFNVPGLLFELEDGQQGRQGGQCRERGQTEVVAKLAARVVEERQRDEESDQQYFQPHGHGLFRLPVPGVSMAERNVIPATTLSRRVHDRVR